MGMKKTGRKEERSRIQVQSRARESALMGVLEVAFNGERGTTWVKWDSIYICRKRVQVGLGNEKHNEIKALIRKAYKGLVDSSQYY